MKKTLSLVLALVLCLSAMAVAFAEPNTDIKGYIEVAGWPSGDVAFKAILDDFNELYPNIEVEYEPTDGSFWYIKYPFADGGGYVEIATTRPETLLGDVAVGIHPVIEGLRLSQALAMDKADVAPQFLGYHQVMRHDDDGRLEQRTHVVDKR